MYSPKVNNFIQKLINEDKIVLHVLLTDLPEVILHHFDYLKKELEHHGSVDILLGYSRQPQVRPLDVEV